MVLETGTSKNIDPREGLHAVHPLAEVKGEERLRVRKDHTGFPGKSALTANSFLQQ